MKRRLINGVLIFVICIDVLYTLGLFITSISNHEWGIVAFSPLFLIPIPLIWWFRWRKNLTGKPKAVMSTPMITQVFSETPQKVYQDDSKDSHLHGLEAKTISISDVLRSIGSFLCALTLGLFLTGSLELILSVYTGNSRFWTDGWAILAATFIISGLVAIIVMGFSKRKGIKWLIIPMAFLFGITITLTYHTVPSMLIGFLIVAASTGGILAFIISSTLKYRGGIFTVLGLSFGILLYTIINLEATLDLIGLGITDSLVIIGSLLWALGTKFSSSGKATNSEIRQGGILFKPGYRQLLFYIPSMVLGLLIGANVYRVEALIYLGILMLIGNVIIFLKPLKNNSRFVLSMALVIIGFSGIQMSLNISFSVCYSIYGFGLGLLSAFIFLIFPRINEGLSDTLQGLLISGCLFIVSLGATLGRLIALNSVFASPPGHGYHHICFFAGLICLLSGILPWILMSKESNNKIFKLDTKNHTTI